MAILANQKHVAIGKNRHDHHRAAMRHHIARRFDAAGLQNPVARYAEDWSAIKQLAIESSSCGLRSLSHGEHCKPEAPIADSHLASAACLQRELASILALHGPEYPHRG